MSSATTASSSLRHLARRRAARISSSSSSSSSPCFLLLSRRTLSSSPRALQALPVNDSSSSSNSDLDAQIRQQRHRQPRTTLVAPPDPVSNLRPVVYGDDPLPAEPSSSTSTSTSTSARSSTSSNDNAVSIMTPTASASTHPYSLDEFDGDPASYRWRLERQQLDVYNHAFWTESNTRFTAAKAHVLAALPPTASAAQREAALSDFYARWLAQERARLREYADTWSRHNARTIILAARAAVLRFRLRFFGGQS